jgi:hypothetical protein
VIPVQDVASPHCGDKRMARRCTRFSNHFIPKMSILSVAGNIENMPLEMII